MSQNPDNDALNPPAVPPSGELSAVEDGGAGLPSLEAALRNPIFMADDLSGAKWNEPQHIPDSATRFWEGPGLTDNSVLKAIISPNAAAGPGQFGQIAIEKPPANLKVAVRPAQRAAKKTPPPERQNGPAALPNLDGNFADLNRILMERIHSIPGSPEADSAVPGLARNNAAIDSGPEFLEPNLESAAQILPAHATEAVANEVQANSPAATENLSKTIPESISATSSTPAEAFALASPSSADPGEQAPIPIEQFLFQSFFPREEEYIPPLRIPHLGHVLMLGLLAFVGLLGASLLTRSAFYFHLWGISNVEEAVSDVHYTIGSMAALYLIAFLAALLMFPPLWKKGLLAGLQWNGSTALHHFWRILGAACTCFLLAMVDEVLLPGPTNAPIDKLFGTQTDAWILFAFGVTFAPFFEEFAFRGFLLPALCTAFDWCVEKVSGNRALPPDRLGHPRWSIAAMVFASIATSVPFALMHAEQTAWSLGPFLLLVAVSLVLCWVRLSTRSLAASVMVHSLYNFLLFSLMLLGTSGFKHLEKM